MTISNRRYLSSLLDYSPSGFRTGTRTTTAPNLYSSAVEAALANATGTGSPCYSSDSHLNRPFVLTDTGFFWGSYAVHAPHGPRPQTYRTVKADELAAIFCALLIEHQPESVERFKSESMALRAYYHGSAPVSSALVAVFDTASRFHRIRENTFQCVGFGRGVHAAKVWDTEGSEHCVFFDEQLVLTQVWDRRSRLGRPPQV